SAPICSEFGNCFDGIDNDGDGLVDCADPDCAATCGEDCDNGIDDDGNGLVDCADPDCFGVPPCGGGEDCTNGTDDDGDGLVDCFDVLDCCGNFACAG